MQQSILYSASGQVTAVKFVARDELVLTASADKASCSLVVSSAESQSIVAAGQVKSRIGLGKHTVVLQC